MLIHGNSHFNFETALMGLECAVRALFCLDMCGEEATQPLTMK